MKAKAYTPFIQRLGYRISICLRIEVHFILLHWEMKGHWSCVNLVKHEVPNANEKVYFNLYIYAKAMKNP